LIDKALLSEVKRLHFRTRKMTDESLLGGYRSAFKGQGIEFEDVREYSAGDDVRLIDWKVTARARKPYIKRFKEERELSVLIAVDVSSSTLTGSNNKIRERVAAQVGAILTLIALRNNDQVGLLTYSDRVESYHPPKKSRASVWRIIREVISTSEYNPKTDLGGLCHFLLSVLKRKTIVFVISDYFDNDYEDKLAALRAKHDVTSVVLEDSHDYNLPDTGLLNIRCPETGRSMSIDTSFKLARDSYAAAGKARKEKLHKLFAKAGINNIWIDTNDDPLPVLQKFFLSKSRSKIFSNHA